VKLVAFRVQNYRSINDSGEISVQDLTALVGRNESGKSNLLLALASLNPPSGFKNLSFTKDFPRDRPRSEFSEELKVVDTTWELSIDEQAQLARQFPRATGVTRVTVGRQFKASRYIGFLNLRELSVDIRAIEKHLAKIAQSVNGSLRGVDESTSRTVKAALAQLVTTLTATDIDPNAWASSADAEVNTFVQSVQSIGMSESELVRSNLASIRQQATAIQNDDAAHTAARKWVLTVLPVFIYLSDYPELQGHQNIPLYLERKRGHELTEGDQNFEKLVKVAGLDPEELDSMRAESHEDRQLLTNRAAATVTRRLRELWTDRPLKIRFALDAEHFDTLISDPNAVYDVEVNLDERSRGFKWFFSFYVTFTADTEGGPADDAILLLDEPGLYLHATAQRDLLDHLAKNFKNQVIYTTHSPFMIQVSDIPSIRTVNIDPEAGTTVTNDPTGDYRTLFPLTVALGIDLTQTLFIGEHNLVVEGVTDFWYLSAVSDFLRDNGGNALPKDLVITPAGGAQKVAYMATFLSAQRLNVLVLFDDERDARATAKELVRSKLIRNENVIFVGDGNESLRANGVDIEDLLDPDMFTELVNQTYADELSHASITLNANIPRIVKRYESAFQAAGLEFHKTRPAKAFLHRIAQEPSTMTPITRQNFQALFDLINERFQELRQSNRKPFR